MIQELLTEKLRPKQVEHMILPKRIRASFKDKKLSQHLLLAGSPGCGKTTLAKILAAGYPTKFINVSDESSVDIIRGKINDFCRSISIMDGKSSMKVVILDEFDGASAQFYKAVRGTIEKFQGNTRFIATCNWLNNVPEPVQSRFEVINFDPVNAEEEEYLKEEWQKRIELILGKVGMTIDQESLEEFTRASFPDLRTALNRIQSWMIDGTKNVDIAKIKNSGWSYEDLYNILVSKPDPAKNYQVLVGQYGTKVEDVMTALGGEFIDWILGNRTEHIDKIPGIIVKVAEHQSQRALVIDPVVSLLSLFFQIQKIINQ